MSGGFNLIRWTVRGFLRTEDAEGDNEGACMIVVLVMKEKQAS